MIKEYSFGAVCYKIVNDEILFLIEHMNLGHYALPKGHQEKGEAADKTALREIKEETNLDVILDTRFCRTVSYSPSYNVIKDVTYYLAKIISNEVKEQVEEVAEILFLPYEKALNILTYDSDKNVLSEAYMYMKKEGV